MKKKLAHWIVRSRLILLAAILLLAGWSVFQISRTVINFDLTRYLSDDTMTKKALTVMEEEFGASEQLRLLFENQDDESLRDILSRLEQIPEIMAVQYNPETDRKEENGVTLQLVTLTLEEADAAALVPALREMFPDAGHYIVDGSAARLLDIQKGIGSEMTGIMVIAVLVVSAVLLLTSHAWLEPVLLLIVFAVSILINMGTNFLFRDVSFITFAVCAILQLALSIDYAIMLLHSWNRFCDSGLNPEESMEQALAECFMRIFSSAMTTVAGLLSLLFMSFTIGFDIGMVLSKGILISMLCVFLLMPSLTLIMKPLIRKTRHRPFSFGGAHLGKFIYIHRKPVALLLTGIVLAGAFFAFQNEYLFTEPNLPENTDSGRISALFGSANPMALLVPGDETDESYDQQRTLVGDLSGLKRADGTPVVRSITAMVTVGEAALKDYSAEEVAEMTGMNSALVSLFFAMNGFGESVRADRLLAASEAFAGDNEQIAALREQLNTARRAFIGKHFHRILLEPAFSVTDSDFTDCMNAILETAEHDYSGNACITGGPMSVYDIGNAFRGDLLKVNLITLAAILLIVICSFRSFLLPTLLVFIIEGAIWITMGISKITGEPIFFICYLICLSIQMGATIDYAILVSDQYRIFRGKGLSIREALQETMRTALSTILTSGTILVTAGYIVGKQSSIYYIYSIGFLISRGALMSVLLVLTLLPALLALFDRVLITNPRSRGEPSVSDFTRRTGHSVP